MNILEFVDLAKKHRLSVKNVCYPYELDGWKNIIFESLMRNNSVLLDELYIKCPIEYKEDIGNYICNLVFSKAVRIKNEYPQTILNWVFNHLSINFDDVFNPVFIAQHARGDLIDFLIKDNSEDIFADRLYDISKWLAKEEQVELFKKIACKLDLNNLHEEINTCQHTNLIFNPFIALLENSKDKHTLKYVLENVPNKKDYYLNIIKMFSMTLPHLSQNIEYNNMLEITLSFLKEKRLNVYEDLQKDILDKDSKLVFKNLNRVSVFNVKTLDNHGMFSTSMLYRAMETVGTSEYENILEPSLHFLYKNFNEEIIDKSFSQKHKMELFANLMIRDAGKEAEFIYNKAPYILNDDIKDYITTSLLRKGGKSGLEWAKRHLSYDEIDIMCNKPFYNKNLEQLTLWKCENFLYSENKNIENRVEKKKIKL